MVSKKLFEKIERLELENTELKLRLGTESGCFYIFKHAEGNYGHLGQTIEDALNSLHLKTGLNKCDFRHDSTHDLI